MLRVPTRLLYLLALSFVLSITAQAQKKLPGSVPPWPMRKTMSQPRILAMTSDSACTWVGTIRPRLKL